MDSYKIKIKHKLKLAGSGSQSYEYNIYKIIRVYFQPFLNVVLRNDTSKINGKPEYIKLDNLEYVWLSNDNEGIEEGLFICYKQTDIYGLDN